MNEQTATTEEAPATATPVSSSTLGWVVLFGVGAALAYQLFIRPDQGERTVRMLLANQ